MKKRTFGFGTTFLALGGLGLIACDDGSAPAHELVEAWTLESWYGQEPPLTLYEEDHPDEPGVVCTHVLVSSEIELRTEQHVDMIDGMTRTCGAGSSEPYTETRHGTWTTEGDSLFLAIEADDPVLPEANMAGEMDGQQLRFEFEVFSEAGGIDTVAIVYRSVLVPF